jgi:4'-phosphopantetheinyl transferase
MATIPCAWDPPPADPTLPEGEVHVWRASLDLPREQAQALDLTLSAGERERAARFQFEADRRRFTVGRGLLRAILGRYLRIAPSDVQFSVGQHGKPALAESLGQATIRFNLAHSGDLALYAISHNEVGIDIELIRPIQESEQIAERYYSRRERAALHSLSQEGWNEAFLRHWTRTEAYLKARGYGLSLEPDQFEVLPDPGGTLTLEVAGDPREATRWSLVDLTPGSDYVGALAVEGHDWSLSCRQWAW